MRLRTFLPSAVGLGMLLAAAPAFAAYSDVAVTHPSYKAIRYVETQGIMQGYAGGVFRPDRAITRAEFTSIVMGIHPWGLETEQCNDGHAGFSDIDAGVWYSLPVCKALYSGIIQGNGRGQFRPNDPIRFKEAAKIAVGAYGFITDVYGEWYDPLIGALEARDAVPAGVSNAEHVMTRAEAAEMYAKLEWFMQDKDRVEKLKKLTSSTAPQMSQPYTPYAPVAPVVPVSEEDCE